MNALARYAAEGAVVPAGWASRAGDGARAEGSDWPWPRRSRRRGAETVLAARTRSEVEDAAMALRDRGGKAEALVLDVTDISGAGELIAKQPAFDIAVINAGTNRPKLMAEVTEEDYDVVLDLNVKAAYFSAQAVGA